MKCRGEQKISMVSFMNQAGILDKEEYEETKETESLGTEESIGNGNDDQDRQTVEMTSIPSLRDSIDEQLGHQKVWAEEGYLRELIMRSFPIWASILILILTRVEQLGIKEFLTKTSPSFSIHFGSYGTFRLSVSGVFQLQNVLTYPGLDWIYALFYLPFIIPFVIVSILTMLLYRKEMICKPRELAVTICGRLANPAIAFCGTMVLLELMIQSDTMSPAYILGTVLADWLQGGFIVISPLLGALGAFFSGSGAFSNFAFGDVQLVAAESIGTSTTSMLALQAVGAAAGNGICLAFIIAACVVVDLHVAEGLFIRRTYKFVLSSIVISLLLMLAFFFRF